MNMLKSIVVLAALWGTWLSPSLRAQSVTIAAAADLKFALDDVAANYRKAHPSEKIEVVYGSSGKFQTQIQQGAPYDIFFSADISFPRELAKAGWAASEVKPYAVGRLVIWSATVDATKLTLASLADPKFARIAIANPKHAPYGKRAEEALRAVGLWDALQSRLVYGENIAQTAQFVQTGNAQVGLIALSLAVNPELAAKGGYAVVPEKLHQPLEQGFIITKRAAGNASARAFAEYVASGAGRTILKRYGFALPGDGK
ncbi:MAG TPA: molybdate ABC transporter substrate-binding protein [Holophaga sp.]|nr:molybdate ABC transporter substrate-binding protein [Holophaga sp.]